MLLAVLGTKLFWLAWWVCALAWIAWVVVTQLSHCGADTELEVAAGTEDGSTVFWSGCLKFRAQVRGEATEFSYGGRGSISLPFAVNQILFNALVVAFLAGEEFGGPEVGVISSAD
ncbi:MAG: hypothetical protein ABJZ55_20340 [Fuerstiella sp.]